MSQIENTAIMLVCKFKWELWKLDEHGAFCGERSGNTTLNTVNIKEFALGKKSLLAAPRWTKFFLSRAGSPGFNEDGFPSPW